MDAELWGVTGGVETEREEGIWKALGSQLLSSRSQLSPQGARGNICSEDLSQQTDPLLLEGRPQHGVLEAGEPSQIGWGRGRKPPLPLWRWPGAQNQS